MKPPLIGLAGGVGSGKSTAAAALAAAGCVVIDADELAREVLRDDEVRATLVAWWGSDILGADGCIDRSRVADIVFEDDAQRRRLEDLMHPRIEARRAAAVDAVQDDVPAIVIDAPLLFEVGLDGACQAVIFIDVPRETRLKRVQETRGWTDAELHRREVGQLDLDEKRSRSHHMVVDPESPEALSRQVLQFLQDIRARHH